ncbi:MAG: hypothetical protein ACRD2D_01175 [Terriglobales bacterium]
MPHLSEIQRRHLHDGLAHLEKLLRGMQAILDEAPHAGLFPRYRDDLSAPERERLARGVTGARASLADGLRQFELAPEPAALSAAAAVRAQAGAAELAAEELGARDMRGYGPLAQESAAALDELAARLRAAVAAIVPGGGMTSAPAGNLAEALASTTDDALAAMASALAAAVLDHDASSEALPLVAADALTVAAQSVCRAAGAKPPPEIDASAIRWRLDRPKLARLGRDFLVTRFRKQLEPRREEVRDALRAYGRRAIRGNLDTP